MRSCAVLDAAEMYPAKSVEVEMSQGVVRALKVIVAVMMATLFASQVWLFPFLAADAAEFYPEFVSLKVPLLVLVEAALVCVQVFLVCLWVLVGRVVRGSIFETSSLAWVSALAVMPIGVSCASVIAIFYIPGPPLLGLAVLLIALICLGLSLLLVVMRSLLVQASADHAEMQGVI